MKKAIIIIAVIIVLSLLVIAGDFALKEYEEITKSNSRYYPNIYLCDRGKGVIEDTTCISLEKNNCYIHEDKQIILKCETGWKTSIITTIEKPKLTPSTGDTE